MSQCIMLKYSVVCSWYKSKCQRLWSQVGDIADESKFISSQLMIKDNSILISSGCYLTKSVLNDTHQGIVSVVSCDKWSFGAGDL